MLNIFLPILDAAPAASPAGGGSSMLIFILLMILIFYFFMIRPQQKKQKKIEEARNSLQKGDRIVTIGGIHGKITDIKDNTFTIEIAHDVRIEVDKAAISFNEADLNQKSDNKKEEKIEEKKENE
jgi:preprotein translocase subunit YajC